VSSGVRWDETYGGHLAGARAQATIFLLFPRDGASGPEDLIFGGWVAKSIGNFFRFRKAAKLGKLSLEEGAKFANKSEELIANKLITEGKNIKVLARKTGQGVKTPDFLVDGVKTELKTISNIVSKDLSGRIAKKIKAAGNQAGSVIIDLTKQKGASEDVAKEALNRAFGSSTKIDQVRIIGEGFDIIKKIN
jgi:hypothetical protein